VKIQNIFSKTSEQYRSELISRNPPIEAFLENKVPVVIYPGASLGRAAAKKLQARDINVVAFSDTKEANWNSTIDGLEVIPPHSIDTKFPECVVLIASALYDSEIRSNLAHHGVTRIYPLPFLSQILPEIFGTREYRDLAGSIFAEDAKNDILKVHGLLADDISHFTFQSKLRYYLTLDKSLLDLVQTPNSIYFDPDLFSMEMGRIIADGGAFTGDTLAQFLKSSKGAFEHYYAFDPDPLVQERLHQVASVDPDKIQCIKAGLSNESRTLHFKATGLADSIIVKEAGAETISIPVVDLDTFFADKEPPTFIKMDIEGSEAHALFGAKNLIVKHKPVLAISIYHNPSDLWKIPLIIKDLLPESKIYIRHYTREIDDTVCYAIPTSHEASQIL